MSTRKIVTTTLASNEVCESVGIKARYGDERLVFHQTQMADQRALLASAFCERWAMVAAEPDGEDSAGRQKFRRMEPPEMAKHACETVEALYQEFHGRGWFLDVPSFSVIMEQLAAKELAQEAAEIEPSSQRQSQELR